MTSLFAGPIAVAYHIVTWLSQVLTPLTGGLATAAAIVAFTIAVRLLLSPLTFLGMRGQTRIAAVQPRIAELRAKYARQPDKLQAELSALYASEAGGMLAGCLPLLLQLPFFSVMYRLFLSGTVGGKPNELLHRTLFGTPLGSHWLSGLGPVSGQGLVFLGLFALLAVIAWLSARAARSAAGSPAGLAPAPRSGSAVAQTGTAKTGAHKTGAHKTGTVQTASPVNPAGLTAITRLLPFTTLVIAAFVPLAAGLYLLTSSAWTLAERVALRRRIAPAANGAVAVPMAGSAR
jgi:YidC/Oxa1 family membrane protein insertase